MENWDMAEWIAALVIVFVVFWVYALIIRAVFSVNKHIKQQEMIIRLLTKIAAGETLTKEQKEKMVTYLAD